jgi:hypothetical protein
LKVVVEDLQFQVVIDPGLPSVVEGALSFETGASKDLLGPGVYNHHGEEFSPWDCGALTRFYEDLVLGTPTSLIFATHGIGGPDTILAMAIFMHRDLAILPSTTGLVASIDLVHRFGRNLQSHIDPLLSGFLRSFNEFFPSSLSKKERGERIGLAVQWVRDYLVDGSIPNLGEPLPKVEVLDVGTNGFVIGRSDKPSGEAWEVLFRQGYLRGVILGLESPEGLEVLIARKHQRSWVNLNQALVHLNELEGLSGGEPCWVCEEDFIRSPKGGTKILVNYLIEVLLRI